MKEIILVILVVLVAIPISRTGTYIHAVHLEYERQQNSVFNEQLIETVKAHRKSLNASAE